MALPRAKPGEVVDLRPLGSRLRETKSAALVKTAQFEAIRLVVPAGTDIPSHDVAGNITLYCLEGRVSLGLGAASVELGAGEWIYLDRGEAHSMKGVEDASLLLTIMLDN